MRSARGLSGVLERLRDLTAGGPRVTRALRTVAGVFFGNNVRLLREVICRASCAGISETYLENGTSGRQDRGNRDNLESRRISEESGLSRSHRNKRGREPPR